jgi:predicted RND superfamily exporter protein
MSRLLGGIARFITQYPKSTFLFGILLTAISIGLSLQLQIKSSLTELLPQDTEHVVNLKEISNRAGGLGYLNVSVEGTALDTMKSFADSLYKRIQNDPHIRYIYYKNDLQFIKHHALLFLSPIDLEKIEKFLNEKVEKERAKMNPFYVDLLADLEGETTEKKDEFGDYIQFMSKYAFLGREYITNNDSNFLVMLIKPKEIAANIDHTKELVDVVQAAVDDLSQQPVFKTLKVRLSGRYVSQLLQKQAISRDLKSTAAISAFLIFLVLSIFFKKRRTFIIIGIPLVMGLAWTFGLTYLVVGELNLITTFLVAILLGLGINFGIHFFKRYLEFRETQPPAEAVISMYSSSVGVGSITASLTTAAAFFSLIFTQFRGFNQFGIIAGIGSVLTLVAYFLIFPSIIMIYEKYYPIKNTRTHLFPRIYFAEKLIGHQVGIRMSFYTLVVLGLIFSFSIQFIQFEYDFNRLGTETYEDAQLRSRINNLFDASLSPTIVMVDSPEKERQVVQAVKEFISKGSETIVTVRDLNSIVPTEQPQKIQIIQRIKKITEDKLFTFLEGDKKKLFDQFSEYLNVAPITVEMLPSYLTNNFKGQINPDDRFVLIYPGIELSNGKQVMKYAKELSQITVNGEPLRACSESLILADILRLISRDGTIAILVTLFTILALLWLHFKKFRTMWLTSLPILLGTLALLGIMGIFGIKFNFINIVALPIILGIGVDNSVHFYHRYKEDHSLWHAFYHTGMAMFLTTLTTTIGFGSLIFAQHRGLKTLGVVAVLGLFLNLLTTFIILPILIKLNSHHSFRILFSSNHKAKIPTPKNVAEVTIQTEETSGK